MKKLLVDKVNGKLHKLKLKLTTLGIAHHIKVHFSGALNNN